VKPFRWASARATTTSPCCNWRRLRDPGLNGGLRFKPHLVREDQTRRQHTITPRASDALEVAAGQHVTSSARPCTGLRWRALRHGICRRRLHQWWKDRHGPGGRLGKDQKYSSVKPTSTSATTPSTSPLRRPMTRRSSGLDCGKRRLGLELPRPLRAACLTIGCWASIPTRKTCRCQQRPGRCPHRQTVDWLSEVPWPRR
jgi:hypothetical protein